MIKLKTYLSLIWIDPFGLELSSLCYKFICPLLIEVNLELWPMRLMLFNRVGNVDIINRVLRLRVSIFVSLFFHYITLLV